MKEFINALVEDVVDGTINIETAFHTLDIELDIYISESGMDKDSCDYAIEDFKETHQGELYLALEKARS